MNFKHQVAWMIRWEDVKQDFEPDGALRDIYVEHATLDDWDRVLRFVHTNCGPVKFSVDGDPAAVPTRIQDVFAASSKHALMLNFDVGGIDIACHFFAVDEIEFDLMPVQVAGPKQLDALVQFLRSLAALTGKPVLLTPENCKGSPILRAREAHVEYCPPQYP